MNCIRQIWLLFFVFLFINQLNVECLPNQLSQNIFRIKTRVDHQIELKKYIESEYFQDLSNNDEKIASVIKYDPKTFVDFIIGNYVIFNTIFAQFQSIKFKNQIHIQNCIVIIISKMINIATELYDLKKYSAENFNSTNLIKNIQQIVVDDDSKDIAYVLTSLFLGLSLNPVILNEFPFLFRWFALFALIWIPNTHQIYKIIYSIIIFRIKTKVFLLTEFK